MAAARVMIAGSLTNAPAMLRPASSRTPVKSSAQLATTTSATVLTGPIRRYSAAPSTCAMRILTAPAMPIGSIYSTPPTLNTIWLAASAVAPSQPIITPATVSEPPSSRYCTPIGTPSRRYCRKVAHW